MLRTQGVPYSLVLPEEAIKGELHLKDVWEIFCIKTVTASISYYRFELRIRVRTSVEE